MQEESPGNELRNILILRSEHKRKKAEAIFVCHLMCITYEEKRLKLQINKLMIFCHLHFRMNAEPDRFVWNPQRDGNKKIHQ